MRNTACCPALRASVGVARLSKRRFVQCAFVAAITGATVTASSASDWSQFYAGIGFGADAITGEVEVGLPDPTDSVTGEGLGGGNFGGSLTIGYDHQVSQRLVAGVFATYNWSSIETAASLSAGGDRLTAELLRVEQSWTLGARAGVLITPDSLLYGLVGYTQLKLNDFEVRAPGLTFNFDLPTFSGVTFGGGLEHKLSDHVSLRAEYSYTSLGRETDFELPGVAVVESEKSIHSARLMASYRFGASTASEARPSADKRAGRNWTALYISAGAGADIETRDIVGAADDGSDLRAELSGLGGGNVGGSLGIGADYQLSDGLLVGIWGRYDWSNHQTEVSASFNGDEFSGELLSLDRAWMVGGRLGYALSDDSLIYGLLGYGQFEFNDLTFFAVDDALQVNMPKFEGVSLGVGFEKLVFGGLSLKAEYLYSVLQDETIISVEDIGSVSIDPDIHSFRLLASYRFSM